MGFLDVHIYNIREAYSITNLKAMGSKKDSFIRFKGNTRKDKRYQEC